MKGSKEKDRRKKSRKEKRRREDKRVNNNDWKENKRMHEIKGKDKTVKGAKKGKRGMRVMDGRKEKRRRTEEGDKKSK